MKSSVKPNQARTQPKSAPLTDSAFNWVGQYASSPRNRAYSPVLTTPTHSRGVARLSWLWVQY